MRPVRASERGRVLIVVLAILAVVVVGVGVGVFFTFRAAEAPTGDPEGAVALGLCGPTRTEVAGQLADPALIEVSGLVASRHQPDVLWVHNDSGDAARVYAIGTDGSARGTYDVPGAAARDWEDIAILDRTLVVGDIGDNQSVRDAIQLYEIPEPDVPPAPPAGPQTTAPATRIELHYPDGAHDAETLLVDPQSNDGFVITKEGDGASAVYRAPAPWTPGQTVELERVGTLSLGAFGLATAGDISPSGDAIIIRTYTSVFVWGRHEGETVAEALHRKPCRSTRSLRPSEVTRQLEAIGFDAAGTSYFTTGEGASPRLDRVVPKS